MEFSVDLSLDMKVNRNCELCRQKVSELLHSLNVVYSVDFVGADDSMKLKARGNPYMIMFIMDKYGEHGKITNLRLDGDFITSRPGGGFNGQSGYYLPNSNAAAAAGNYPYPSPYPYPYPPPPQHYFAGNCVYPMPNQPPQQQTEAPKGIYRQHTSPPSFTHPPPPPRPLYSYAYIEPPYWPMSSSDGGNCVIM